jgi:hypothetical protein
MKMVPWHTGPGVFTAQNLPTLTVETMGVHHRLPISGGKIGIVGN